MRSDKTHTSFSSGHITAHTWTPGHPLKVDGCLIMLCERGHADFSINSGSFTMTSGCLGFIGFDMVAVPVRTSADFRAAYMSVGFDETQDLYFLVTSNRFWEFVYKSPVSVLPEELRRPLKEWFRLFAWMADNSSEAIRHKVLRNEAENFILNMAEQVESRLGILGSNPSKNRAWTIINDFVGLIDRNYAAHHDVAFYAERLNVTPNYLNIITRRNIGTSAKEQINIQIGLVARMLLDTTDLSVKQIAERLHYDDPSYLCRIFRKQTGMSPIQYRNKNRQNPKVGISL